MLPHIHTQLDLSKGNHYQTIYATQLYGSFFDICGKFDCVLDESQAQYTISGADLKVIMYKGLLNLGVTRAILFEIPNADDPTINDAVLGIEVQAAPDFNVLDAKEVQIESSTVTLTKGKSQLFIRRVLKRIDDRPTSIKMHYGSMLENIFDEEFEYREGISQDSRRSRGTDTKPEEWDTIQELLDNKIIESIKRDTQACPRRNMIIV